MDDLLVRADYIEGFRAPSVSDLFLGSFRGGALIKDPCAAINHPQPSTASRCADAGVPEDVVDFYGTGRCECLRTVRAQSDLRKRRGPGRRLLPEHSLAYSALFNSYFPDYDVPGRYFYL